MCRDSADMASIMLAALTDAARLCVRSTGPPRRLRSHAAHRLVRAKPMQQRACVRGAVLLSAGAGRCAASVMVLMEKLIEHCPAIEKKWDGSPEPFEETYQVERYSALNTLRVKVKFKLERSSQEKTTMENMGNIYVLDADIVWDTELFVKLSILGMNITVTIKVALPLPLPLLLRHMLARALSPASAPAPWHCSLAVCTWWSVLAVSALALLRLTALSMACHLPMRPPCLNTCDLATRCARGHRACHRGVGHALSSRLLCGVLGADTASLHQRLVLPARLVLEWCHPVRDLGEVSPPW